MASTCASCMSLMAAGVPIKAMVAGISCGLVTGDTDDDFLVLTAVSYTHLSYADDTVYDLFIACDCSDTGRLGSAAK